MRTIMKKYIRHARREFDPVVSEEVFCKPARKLDEETEQEMYQANDHITELLEANYPEEAILITQLRQIASICERGRLNKLISELKMIKTRNIYLLLKPNSALSHKFRSNVDFRTTSLFFFVENVLNGLVI